MEPWWTGRNLMVALFVGTNVIVVSILMVDFSPILTKFQLYTPVNSDVEAKQEPVDWAPSSGRKEEDSVEREDPTAWTRHSLEWWENEKLSLTDVNWRGRHHMHDTLKNGNLWYDENFKQHFIATLERHQFPSNCSKNHWIAYQPMVSGLLSCVHVITAVLMMGLVKGDPYTLIPVGYLTDSLPTNPTYDGCGERKDKHLGCFFNFTSCRVEDDQVRYNALVRKSNSTNPDGDTWEEFMTKTTAPGGMSIVRNWVWPPIIAENVRIKANSKKPKVLFWNEARKHGSVGMYGMLDEALEHIWEDQMEFALTSMVSSWMLRQTSRRVKEISDEIMAKYSDARGRPLWKAPVLTIHIRQTDKSLFLWPPYPDGLERFAYCAQWEDPYYQKYQKYRNVSDYIDEMNKFETMYGFKWQSLFLISDSGSALQTLAEAVNGMSGLPDSANGQEGKRFIMYDWTDDQDLIERTGGHNLIPEDKKHTAQEHFLATLYAIEKISDYAIVQYSSNVGRFISELIGSRHRVSCADRIGPNALSMDYYWRHD